MSDRERTEAFETFIWKETYRQGGTTEKNNTRVGQRLKIEQ